MSQKYQKLIDSINHLTLSNAQSYFDNNEYSDLMLDLGDPLQSIKLITNGYRVNVEFNKEKLFSYNCDCIIGKNGIICKHIALAILVYIDRVEKNIDNELSKIIFNYTDDLKIIKLIQQIESAKNIFLVLLKPFSLNLEIIDDDFVEMVVKHKDKLSSIIKKLMHSIEDFNQSTRPTIKLIYEKFILIIKFINFINSYQNRNLLNKIILEEFFNEVSNLCKIEINQKQYGLPLVYKPNNEVHINVAKTAIGYLIDNNIITGTFIVVRERYFFFLVTEKQIEWFIYDEGPIENPNLLFKLNFKSSNENNFYKKIEEIRSAKFFKPIINSNINLTKEKSHIKFYYDFNQNACALEIINNKKVISQYFSKFIKSFINDNGTSILYLTRKNDIIDVFNQLKKIKTNEKIPITIDQILTKKRNIKLIYNFSLNKVGLINFEIDSFIKKKDLIEIYQAYESGQKYVVINHKLYDVDEFDFKAVELNFDGIGKINKDDLSITIDKNNMFYLSYQFNNEFLNEIVDKFEQEIKDNVFVSKDEFKYLKDYQLYGVNWLINILNLSHGCILGDEMGLGKTIQAIHLLRYQYKKKNNKPTLIILPLSLISNWQEEFKKFYPEAKVIAITGNAKERSNIINNVKNDCIYITTYSLIKNDISQLTKYDFLNIILDEGQYIKNVNTGWTKEIKKIKSINRLILSGTPIENNVMELWSIFDFIMPNYLPNFSDFKKKYLSNNTSEKDLYELSLKVKPFILQRTKAQFLDLPTKMINNIYVKMSNEERVIYNNMILDFRDKLRVLVDSNNAIKNKMQILTLITRLRQFCCSSKLLDINTSQDSKLNECINLIESILHNNKKAKIVLFSNFKTILDLIYDILVKRNIKPLLITGTNKRIERDKIIQSFEKDHNHNILLMSLKVGGVGLNLNFANNVILYNPWWNESVEMQAMDRLHRIGQKQEINVYKLIYEDSIESNIEKLKQNKIDIINKTFNQLTFKDLLKIVNES